MNIANAKCVSVSKFKKIKIVDARSCHCYFINSNLDAVKIIKVDGCAITSGCRCDFALISKEYPENFVELKGGDVQHAIVQLVTTVNKLSSDAKCGKKRCIIISTMNPLTSTQTQMQKVVFKKDYNALLLFGRPGQEFSI
jgi:hypothetical protein